MSENTRRTAGVPLGAYSDYRPRQRVMTVDGFPGTVISVQEGPASNNIEVVLDNGMGGGTYDDSMLSPLNERAASVDRTASDDYPELGSILTDRPDLAPVLSEHEYLGGRTASLRRTADYYLDTPESLALSSAAADLIGASNAAMHKVRSASDVVPEHLSAAVVVAAMVHCDVCDVDYAIDSEDEKHDHAKTASRTFCSYLHCPGLDQPLIDGPDNNAGDEPYGDEDEEDEPNDDVYHEACWRQMYPSNWPHHNATKMADYHLFLPEKADEPGSGRSQAYKDGATQAVAGGAREPKNPGDAAYMADFDMGWAHGVQSRPDNPEIPLTDPSDLADDTLDPDKVAAKSAGIVDFLKGDSTPSKTWQGPGHNYSFDWCRFRKNSRCMFPKELNKAATDLAGYAVWIPEDRGYCPRIAWDQQKECPVGEPGPNVPGGYTDATVPWEQGGQRGGYPREPYRHGSKTAKIEDIERYVRPVPAGEICDWPPHEQHCTCGNALMAWAEQNWTTEHNRYPETDAELAEVKDWARVLADSGQDKCDHCDLDHKIDRTATKTVAKTADTDGFAFHFTAAWSDVRKKAKRIRQEGGVRVLSSQSGDMVAQVKGDHYVYQTRITSVPGRFAVGSWECGCPWAAYSWGRTGPWKKYEGRMCSHALAAVYEAQSRGMFGKAVTEDEVAPAWVPKGGDGVKVPGDWDRDLGAYTSAKTDSWELVALLVASGKPIAQIHPTVMAMALDSGRVVASKGPLSGQVGGRVRDLIFEDGEIIDAATGVKITGPVVYPSYDPTAGLNAVATKESTMGAEHWAMTFESGEAQAPAPRAQAVPPRTAIADHFALSFDADLHEEPEPALPTTDGSDEDADIEQARQALLASAAISADSLGVVSAEEAQSFEAKAAAAETKDPHAWLLEGSGAKDGDVASMAQAFLANRKEALKDFSAAERKSIIDEGEGDLAGNFDGLDLTGTHYIALEQAQAAQQANDTLGW